MVEYLPAGLFDPLTQVPTLTLQYMYRLQLPSDAFAGMSSLTHLIFQDCAIWSVHPHAFRGADSIRRLYVCTRACLPDSMNRASRGPRRQRVPLSI